jgi:hypothetical protein
VTGNGWARVASALTVAASMAGMSACGDSAPHRATASTGIEVTAPPNIRAEQQALHAQVTRSLRHHSNGRYGQIPRYLPKSKQPVQRIVVAKPGHPVLAIEGDTVSVQSARGRALVTIVGPDVPDKDQGSFHDTAPVAFDVTFAHVHGTIPLAASRFTITDELGAIHRPRVTMKGGGRVPFAAPPGPPITLVLRTTLPIGNGRVNYRPAGDHALASWDFDNETD